MKPTLPALVLLAIFVLTRSTLMAQDDLLQMLEDGEVNSSTPVSSTWKGMRLISGHTTRVISPGTMDFVISHRFGRFNSGIEEFYGLDDSQIRLALEFGLAKNLNIGIGRSSQNKAVDGFVKYQLLSQKSGGGSPVTVTGFASLVIKTGDQAFSDPEFDNEFSQRLRYSYQLLIARKINADLSLQLMPSLIHRNTVVTEDEPNDIYSLGVGGRYKFTNRMSLNVEYYPQLNATEEYTDALSFGIDLETGGHVFQLHITNSRAMIEPDFIAETDGLYGDGDIHFGFNVSRSFKIKKGAGEGSW